jgi:hypothetical protein
MKCGTKNKAIAQGLKSNRNLKISYEFATFVS